MTTRTVHGSLQTVISSTADLLTGDLSDRAYSSVFSNMTDSVVPYAQLAEATLYVPNWGAAPTDHSIVDIYMTKKKVGGSDTNDETSDGVETDGDYEASHRVGGFEIYNASEAQRITTIISILGVREALFQLYNGTGQTMAGATGTFTMIIVPLGLKNA